MHFTVYVVSEIAALRAFPRLLGLGVFFVLREAPELAKVEAAAAAAEKAAAEKAAAEKAAAEKAAAEKAAAEKAAEAEEAAESACSSYSR